MVPPPSLACALPAPPEGWHRLAASPLADGRIALLLADQDIEREFAKRRFGQRAGDPDALARRARAEIWVYDGDSAVRAVGFDLGTPYPRFDRCPDGRWLVASSRRRDAADDARLIDAEGRVTGTLRLGDGIEHVQFDADGTVWCGWFDEGIFGNSDWSYPGREWPPSSAGLAAFDLAGTCLAEAPPSPDYGGIADCYVLNVTDGAAWACTYMGFPILRLERSGAGHYCATDLSGVRALAVRGVHVVTIGSYDRDRIPFTLLRIEQGEACVIAQGNLQTGRDTERRLPDMHGRGPWLHLIEDSQWQRWHIDQLLAGNE
ncbi:MAG: hypothetical protein NBV68_15900 [Erythrobacter sp.]|uniref:hypothetical protein n=1 Tax=Erythrobacter sp. TaxID=1042 RepID=UPI0025F03AFD|nr:hypothetical protein [Erythrobacter sp.]MCM0000862.1 hypothetical protein [Erythrobacter sp.]